MPRYGTPSPFADVEDAALLRGLWEDRATDLSMFDDAFLEEEPEESLRAIIRRVVDDVGAVESVESAGPGRWTLLSRTHAQPIDLTRDGDGRISGLWLHPPARRAASLEEALASLALPGADVSWQLTRDGVVRGAVEPDRRLAVGSAFKLWVLDVYRLAVAEGRLAREAVRTLDEDLFATPSGILQRAPSGMPITMETLATLMTGLSDNTATDHLIDVLGRERVEALSPFVPLLTTGELSRLRRNPVLERRYADGGIDERRAVLAELGGVPLSRSDRSAPGLLAGVEWYASAAELCDVVERVADEPSMRVDGGLVAREGWASVAEKDGGEIGVFNVTARLVAKSGTRWSFAVTWNGHPDATGRSAPLDGPAAERAVATVVRRLLEESGAAARDGHGDGVAARDGEGGDGDARRGDGRERPPS